MSRQLAGGDRAGLLISHGRAIQLLALIAFPRPRAGGWIYADWLTRLLYGGAYASAGPVLALLSLGWVLFFINIPLGNLSGRIQPDAQVRPLCGGQHGP